MATYVEMFNSAQPSYKAVINYHENPAEAMIHRDLSFDLIIDEYLNSSSVIDDFRSLNRLFDKEELNRSHFYPYLLAMGRKDDQQLVLPLSYQLPMIVFNKENEYIQETEGIGLSIEDLTLLSRQFNENSTRTFPRLSFSPSWSREFLYQFSVVSAAGYRETIDGSLEFNSQNLDQGIDFLKSWGVELNGEAGTEEEFTNKYLYDPWYKLLSQKRIQFYCVTLDDFYSIPTNDRHKLDFRWFITDEGIPVSPNILFAGIPKSAKNKKASRVFLTWLLDTENQHLLIKSNRNIGIRDFGFFHGLSSLQPVNEDYLPELYSHLPGLIPPEDLLVFPQPLPVNWNGIKNEVIEPWLEGQYLGETEDTGLEKSLSLWLLQQE